MKITKITAYQIDLPVGEGSYNWSGGKSVSVFDSTVLGIETDAGITGWGEICPLGPFYLPAYGGGVRAGGLSRRRRAQRLAFGPERGRAVTSIARRLGRRRARHRTRTRREVASSARNVWSLRRAEMHPVLFANRHQAFRTD